MEKDLQKKGYFSDPERFADLINGVMCSGRQILSPADLTEMDSQTGQFDASSGQGKKKLKGRYRDLIRKVAFGMNFMILGIENQEDVHYLMPLRCMSYDAEEYERQAVQIGREIRQRRGISSAEFLSGFTRDSKLSPCITLVLYYGNEWDGATDLHGILDFTGIPEELRDAVNNYRICLCEVRKFENTDAFRTDLKQVFDCIRYSEDPDKLYELVANDPSYRGMEEDTYDIIAKYTKTNELMQVKIPKNEEGKVDMCKAIMELINRGRMEGIKTGMEQGIKSGIEQGMKSGIEQGESRVIELLQTLMNAGRIEDMTRAISDPEYRRQLYLEK